MSWTPGHVGEKPALTIMAEMTAQEDPSRLFRATCPDQGPATAPGSSP